MNKTELEVALIRRGLTVTELSEKLEMNRSTLYRKMITGKFERSEIAKIRDTLKLSDADVMRIFFSDDGCISATESEGVGA